MQLKVAEWETPIRGHRDVCTFLPGLSAVRAPRRVPPAIGDAGGDAGAVTPGARMLTGLALIGMGGLLWLAFQGHVWARDFVQAMWPLFIVIVGVSTVVIVTDGDTVAGKVAVVAGMAIVLLAKFGVVPEVTLQTLGPWALALVGAAIPLSGLGRRARSVATTTATGTEASPQRLARAHDDTPEYQRAKAS